MAFPLAAIGAGLGLGADAITRQREAEMRRAQMMLLQQQMQQQMQEDQRKREALGAMFGLFSNPGSSFTPAGPPSSATNPLGLTGPAMQMPQASQPAPRSPTPAVPGGDQMGDMAPPDVAKLAGLPTTNVFPPDHVRLANFDAPSEFNESGQQSLPPALRSSDPRTGSANPFSWITGGAAPAPVNPSALLAPGRSMSNPLGAVGGAGSAGGIMGAAADASKAAIGLRTSVDPMEMGRMQVPQLAKRIDELYPGLDPVVKGMALQFSAKMLAPDQAATLRAWMQENNANLRVALAEFQAKEREKAAETRASTSGTRLLETPNGLAEWHPGQPIPEGASLSKGGTASNALEMSKTLEVLNDKGDVVRTLLARESRNKAGWVDSATGKPIELKPGETLKQVTPTTSGGGRAGAQVLRQQIGGREVLSDLQNAVSMPVGSTIGWLGTYQPGTSMTGVLGGDLARQLTTQDAQLMQASFASLSRELSILMSPVYGGNWAAQQIDPLIPKSGDTMGTVLFKISRIAQSADNALEALEKAPVLSNDQKSFAKDLRKQILQAVPWTPNEAMSFARGADKGEKDESFADFMKRKPGGKEPAAAKGGGPPQSAVDYLKAHPELREQFDQKYGTGAAATVLGQ